MNQKSHDNLLKSLLLISKIRFSEVDELSKFGKTKQDRTRKLKSIEMRYKKDSPDNKKNFFKEEHESDTELDNILGSLNDNIDPESLNTIFLQNDEYEKLADMINEAMDEITRKDFDKKNEEDFMKNGDFNIFKKEPSFEDLVDWFRLLLLANDGELQLTLTPGQELIMIFKQFVNPTQQPHQQSKKENEPVEEKKGRPRSKTTNKVFAMSNIYKNMGKINSSIELDIFFDDIENENIESNTD